MDIDQELLNAIRDGIREGINSKLSATYNNPLEATIAATLKSHESEFRGLMDDAIAHCMESEQFREEIANGVRSKIAKTLVQRFGGEMEKQVNVLKSDPATRARITLAIEEITKTAT